MGFDNAPISRKCSNKIGEKLIKKATMKWKTKPIVVSTEKTEELEKRCKSFVPLV